MIFAQLSLLLVTLQTVNKSRLFMMCKRWRWSLWAFVFLGISFSHHQGIQSVIAMYLEDPKEQLVASNLAKIHPPNFEENRLMPDFKGEQGNVEIPDFMLENYKAMNRNYCDRRVIWSVPGKVTDEKAKLSRAIISFVVTPFQKENESPYHAEIRLSLQSPSPDPREHKSNTTELFQVIIWAGNNWSQSEHSQNVSWSGDNGSPQSSRTDGIPKNSYPVFDDLLTVPITEKGSSRDGVIGSEAAIDLHSTQVMDALSGMREAWQIILEIRSVNSRTLQSTSANSRLQPSSYFVVHSLGEHINCFHGVSYEADSSRSKRSASFSQTTRLRSLPDGERERPSLCRKRSLYVDFQSVGWDQWILAPSGYWAHYCEGACPFPMSDRLNSTNHAILQSLLHSMVPAIPPSCCVPFKLKPLSILYRDQDEKLVLKQYGNMVVESCACQ